MPSRLKRREVITLLGGAMAAWPVAARAQLAERVRRIGWLVGRAENDPVSRADRAAFQDALAKLGWTEGRNLRIDLRFAADDPDHIRAYAMELIGLAPDVIVTGAAFAMRAVQQQTIPIVFHRGRRPRSHRAGAKY
jgi:putative ABC transport system substrate-binding protein